MYAKILAAMLAVLAFSGTARSQALSATDYVSRFYTSFPGEPEYSPRVKALIRACERRNAECDYGIVMYMGQDMDGPALNFSATLVKQKTNSAVVRVNYADNKGPVKVTYWLLRSGNSWTVDEMVGKGRGICEGLISNLKNRKQVGC